MNYIDKEAEISADRIMEEMSEYIQYDYSEIMVRAIELYNANSTVGNLVQAKNMVECLKLFVKLYDIDKIKHQKDEYASVLKPKIMQFIALCNYKIGNFNRAYCIAKQGLDAVEDTMENAIITGVPRSAYGADTMEELICLLERDYYNELQDEEFYDEIDPEEIYLDNYYQNVKRMQILEELSEDEVEDVTKPSKKLIVGLLDAITQVQQAFSEIGRQQGNPVRAFELNNMLDQYKLPLYFAWRSYRYGWHTDFCKVGDSLVGFMLFEADCVKNTEELVDILKRNSPFAMIEQNSAITNDLIKVYTQFISDLKNGTIKL